MMCWSGWSCGGFRGVGVAVEGLAWGRGVKLATKVWHLRNIVSEQKR